MSVIQRFAAGLFLRPRNARFMGGTCIGPVKTLKPAKRHYINADGVEVHPVYKKCHEKYMFYQARDGVVIWQKHARDRFLYQLTLYLNIFGWIYGFYQIFLMITGRKP